MSVIFWVEPEDEHSWADVDIESAVIGLIEARNREKSCQFDPTRNTLSPEYVSVVMSKSVQAKDALNNCSQDVEAVR
jgi:hypothetical protein